MEHRGRPCKQESRPHSGDDRLEDTHVHRPIVLGVILLALAGPVCGQTVHTYVIHNGPPRQGATTFTSAAPSYTPTYHPPQSSPPAAVGPDQRYQQIYYGDEHYMNAYRHVILEYNPGLRSDQLEEIVRSILYYSYVLKVDPRFVVAVVAHESRFHPRAVSPAGAHGLGQLMPSTAASLHVDPQVPYQNIQGTVRYLKLMLSRFNNRDRDTRMKLALASYNAGYGAVLKYGGIPPYAETRTYVSVVMAEWRRLSGER